MYPSSRSAESVPGSRGLAVAFLLLVAIFTSARTGLTADVTPSLPPGTVAFRDLAYVDGGHARQKLDLFVPATPDGAQPLIIWVHGGGWNKGSKNNCPPLNLGYTRRGCVVASIDYRFSTDAVFPAQIEDCKAAIRWLRAHAADYRIDPNRIGVWGRSAGGHLVALIGTTGNVKRFDVGAHLDVSSRVQAVCVFAGPTDLLEDMIQGDHLHQLKSQLVGGPVDDPLRRALAADASPVVHVSSDDPPFLIVHGGKDQTVPPRQARRLHEALQRVGVPAHLHTINGGPHGIVNAGKGMLFSGPVIPALVQDFFDYRLLGKPTVAAKWSNTMTSASDLQPDTGH